MRYQGNGKDYITRSFTICTPELITGIKRWEGHLPRMEDRADSYRVLMWKPEGSRPLARPRCRWEDNIKCTFKKSGGGGMDWIDLA
jgi:hypothetical protein